MRRYLVIAALCAVTLPVFGRPLDPVRDIGGRIRDRVVRIIHFITTGDGMMPPWPSPDPKP